MGDEGVDSVPEPVPSFISDAGVTGAMADLGVLGADAMALLVVKALFESPLSDPGAVTGVYTVAVEIAFAAAANVDDGLAEIGW